MINGIGSYGTYGTYGTYGYSQYLNQSVLKSNTQNLNASGLNKRSSYLSTLSSATSNFLKQYQSSYGALYKAANNLKNQPGQNAWNTLSAQSSDEKILTVKENFKPNKPGSYKVEVKQLAQAQSNKSGAVDSKAFTDQAEVGFKLMTQKGDFDIKVSGKGSHGIAKTNQQLFTEMAEQINGLGAGVTAKIIQTNGKSQLELTAQKTGQGSRFIAQGGFADQSGLSEKAVQGQDAEYTIDDLGDKVGARSYTSADNQASLDKGGLSIALKQAGSADVTLGVDQKKITEGVQQMVQAYNDTLKLLNDNVQRGTGVAKELQRLVQPPTSESSMKRLGIEAKKDGTLTLDTKKLEDFLTKDPKLASEILGGSHGMAQGIGNDAIRALGASSANLVNKDIADQQNEQIMDPINQMSTYSKSGAYNMMNYYSLGMMMNLWA